MVAFAWITDKKMAENRQRVSRTGKVGILSTSAFYKANIIMSSRTFRHSLPPRTVQVKQDVPKYTPSLALWLLWRGDKRLVAEVGGV